MIYLIVKRLVDIIFSSIGLIVFIPVIFLCGVIIKIESKGSFIYSQERLGKDGKIFTMYKLRSMYMISENESNKWTVENDPRITSIGRFIRKRRIDELPQLHNILRGEMSLVGPRPERPYFAQKFGESIPQFDNRIIVKPGLTGWAQINGGYNLCIKDKLEMDLYYIQNKSLWLDVKIIFKTIMIIITCNGAR